MAKQCLIIKTEQRNLKAAQLRKQGKKPALSSRLYNRCSICGRPRGNVRFFGICRICLREMAHRGLLPGVTKSSW